jgi:ribosomal protein S18 acetylase RimI-like enzyme
MGLSSRSEGRAGRPSGPASVDPPPMPRPTPLLRLSARPSSLSVPVLRPRGGRSLGEAIAAVPPPPPVAESPAPSGAVPLVRGGVAVRPIRASDLQAVLELIDADRLPGRPSCDPHALRRALSGDFPGDPRGWSGFGEVRTVVVVEADRVLGAASYATKITDGTGWLLWLHAGEDRALVDALLDHVLRELGDSTRRRAFSVATGLSFGADALPIRGRPATHAALRARGFERHTSWRYLVAWLDRQALGTPDSSLARAEAIAGPGEHPGWRLSVETARTPAAVLEVALGPDRCGLVQGLEVEPAYRGRGLERSLLREGMRFLRSQGAATAAACVETFPLGDPGSQEVLDLLEGAGFEDVDELWSYEAPAAGEHRTQLIRLPTRFR